MNVSASETKENRLVSGLSYRLVRREGGTEQESGPVLCEHSMELTVNGTLSLRLRCSPEHLTELVYGHLVTQGLIREVCEVKKLQFYGEYHSASVSLTHPEFIRREAGLLSPGRWSEEQIFFLADRFSEGTPLHRSTWAAHSCFLMRGEELLFTCEDIGRHNALDKAIGYALLNEIPLSDCVLYTSGRIPLDMAEKAVMAGVPVLAAKAAPTAEAVAYAKTHRLTLIGAARRDTMRIYTEY